MLSSRTWDGDPRPRPVVGGQAVMEGVMMRNGAVYGIAVRRPDGSIQANRLVWRSMTDHPLLKHRFLRGFPTLLETLVNGIHALNRSVEMVAEEEEERLSSLSLTLTLVAALAVALALFVVAPHLLSLLMLQLGIGGDLDGLTFHVWDGFFKCCIFVAYIKVIARAPEVRRVFQYHGAEHKAIHAFEAGGTVDADAAMRQSRLHARCGTTFVLFVIFISILLHAVLVPALLACYTPESVTLKHVYTLVFKLLLVIPISALAYELVRTAAELPDGPLATALQAPGLMLQRLTTYEPDAAQADVALVALREALGPAWDNVRTPPYSADDAPDDAYVRQT
jgi:uncharacterized protein YqhQ